MSGFEDREKIEESGFSYNQELEFKITARRAKLMGLWAAEKLKLSGAEAETYAKSVVVSDLAEAGFQDLIRRLQSDFTANSIDISDHRLETEAQKFYDIAKKQIMSGE